MKRTFLDSRRKVVQAIIGAFPGGRECAATRLGLELKKFDNHAYESAGSRPLTDEQLHVLEQDAGTHLLAEYVAQLYGGMFVRLPDPETLDNLDLYSRSVRASVKRGAVDLIIEKALEDGVIVEAEAKLILQAHAAYMAERHSEVLAVIDVHSEGCKP
ncbi:YmfL family putative regulatory protein [Pseudomonas citronellolis]|uniref:YmfL family putative regulatory protein n=1 Tax=Pseudomonas citronellolis TaxID=53408 RepID=UPI0023E425C6|nr:YmfL family putative regulatory protein [Pseudomonas citronellolis]MDF3935335.1 YmfL family putative regulatory protein [Pseudomonas citronellolis]